MPRHSREKGAGWQRKASDRGRKEKKKKKIRKKRKRHFCLGIAAFSTRRGRVPFKTTHTKLLIHKFQALLIPALPV